MFSYGKQSVMTIAALTLGFCRFLIGLRTQADRTCKCGY